MSVLSRVFDAESVPLAAVGRLAVLDVTTIILLVLVGEIRHGVDVVAHPSRVLATAAPFLLGWFVVAVLVGAYGDRAFDRGVTALRYPVGAWIGGAGVGLTLRGTDYLSGDAPLSFALVMTGFGLLGLAVVRFVALRTLLRDATRVT